MMVNYKYYICSFSLLERSYLSSLAAFRGVSMINLKTTIDYNTILFKAQLNYIATVSASKAHSKRHVCIKVSESYYIVFALR